MVLNSVELVLSDINSVTITLVQSRASANRITKTMGTGFIIGIVSLSSIISIISTNSSTDVSAPLPSTDLSSIPP